MTAEILTKLGASIVVLPGGEVYSALDKGWWMPPTGRRSR